jgi:hypothetical protein
MKTIKIFKWILGNKKLIDFLWAIYEAAKDGISREEITALWHDLEEIIQGKK